MIITLLKTWNRRRLEARKRQKSRIPHLAIKQQELQKVLSTSHPGVAVRIAIGLLTQNASANQTQACLHAIQQACAGLHESWQAIIHVADTTGAQQFDNPSAPMPGPVQVRHLHLPKHVARSAAGNCLLQEAESAGFTHFIFMSADGLPEPDAIKNLVQMSLAVGDGALIEAILFPDELPKYFHPQTLDTDWASMTCMLIPARIHQTIGAFDEDFHQQGADIDYSWRARSMGFAAKTCPTALYFQSPKSENRVDMAIADEQEQCARLLVGKWRDRATTPRMGEKYATQRNPEVANLDLDKQCTRNRW